MYSIQCQSVTVTPLWSNNNTENWKLQKNGETIPLTNYGGCTVKAYNEPLSFETEIETETNLKTAR